MFVFYCRFFCFKQKTAYEMRISDWSSDVCSSDLTFAQQMTVVHGHLLAGIEIARGKHKAQVPQASRCECMVDVALIRPLRGNGVAILEPAQIGRGSGRERVGQYV